MRIHREGYRSIAVIGIALVVFNIILAMLPNTAIVMLTIPLSGIAWGFFVQFFRNPIRHIPACANCVIAPADGTIVAIEPAYEAEFFRDERLKISIYMSALNVHLNRVPKSGKVIYTRYHPGKYLVAFHPKASELNERNTIVIEDGSGARILVRQIAGILARRIVSYVQEGQTVQMGDELGFIKFGSRCDVFLPLDVDVCVALQQKVKGGVTILTKS